MNTSICNERGFLLNTHSGDSTVLIIVPAFNEEEAIENTINKLQKLRTTHSSVDICVINDGSRDRTAEIVRSHPDIILLDLINNLGIGGAVQTGFRYAHEFGYDVAVQFDADGQHNEEDLASIVRPVLAGDCDMCIGSRFVEKTAYEGSLARRFGIYYFQYLIFLLTGQKFTDATSGYRAMNKKVIALFAYDYPRDYPEPEVIIYLRRKKMVIIEKTVNMHARQGGVSSITPIKSLYYMFKVTLSIIMQKLIKEN